MAAASAWISAPFNFLRQNQPITFHPSSALRSTRPCFRFIIPNILIFSSATVTTSFSRWLKETRTVRSAADNRVVEGNDEYNENESSWAQAAWAVRSGMEKGSGQYNDDDSSRGITKFPRPQEVPWQKELANTVHFMGVIGRAVQFKYTQSGKAFAWTRIGVRSGSDEETMWYEL